MAFKPNPNFKPVPILLYVASWGPDNWVTHDYEYTCDDVVKHDVQPLVFQYGQQKVCFDHGGGEIRYAYHISPKGEKHGAEYLTKTNGTKAKLWNVKSMVKAITSVMAKKYGITEKPTFSVGQMDNNRNDAYATYDCGLTIAAHIARVDGVPEDFGPIWYSYADKRDKDVQCFTMDEKKQFLAACKERLS